MTPNEAFEAESLRTGEGPKFDGLREGFSRASITRTPVPSWLSAHSFPSNAARCAMAAVRIEWKSRNEDGEKCEVMAERVGEAWSFRVRPGRHDDWQPYPDPPVEEWLELLDGIRRRIGRKLLKPDEEKRVLKLLRAKFPDAAK